MYVGKITGGADVLIGHGSPNKHVVISGMSGAGKSVRILDIERHILEQHGTIIALDINGTHADIGGSSCVHISAQEDGLDLRFLDTSFVKSGRETRSNLVQYVVETLCPRQLRGACQLASVYKAIDYAIENTENFACEMDAIACGLKEQDDAAAVGAYNHLRPILEGQIFRKSQKHIERGKLNVLSLQGLNPKTQRRVSEIVLSAIWRKLRIEGVCGAKFTLVLDEFQNLDMHKDTAFFQMLTESRKYGVNMILATQTLAIFSRKELAIIDQAAVKLYFKPSASDVKTIATLVDPKHYGRWSQKLSKLQIGQAITVGDFEVNGRRIAQPILTDSECSEKNRVFPLLLETEEL